jgi:acyl-CoA synthetase (AMP-forming)/AMP-acid ligase II
LQSHPLIFCITFCISIGLIFFPLNPQYTFRSVPHILKDDNDNPSIGLLVCKSKNETVVKWAFEGIDRPLGVATYELDEVLKKTLAEKLPSIEDIENAIEE